MQQHPFYTTRAWRKIARPQALHDAGYVCERCGVSLVGLKQAAHVHHRKPYLTTPALATEPLNLIALCRSCHNAEHHAMKRGHSNACDIDGRPIDLRHPWFKKR
jgi:5-methylcytosine-specific restriction endonuclease McrA